MKFGWFGKKRRTGALEILDDTEWLCGTCGQPHNGMFDLAARAPDPWQGPTDYAPNGALTLDGDFLSEDFCVIDGKYFMVRCVLRIPVHGARHDMGFGCWGSLSRTNFELYVENFDVGHYEGQSHWSSWLCNQLYDYNGTDPDACWMTPQWGRQRPTLKIQDPDHPLARDQRDGITPEKMLKIYRHYGHGPAD